MLGLGVLVKSSVNMGFALNAYRFTGTKYSCDVFPWSGNETDAKADFETASGGDWSKLTNCDMYLTADGTANSSDVYWAGSTGSSNQVWICTPVRKSGPRNQRYETSNGLHIITTHASNIRLSNQRVTSKQQTVKASGYCGINGAWFNSSTDQAILNVAVQDGKYVGPNTQGSENKVGSGIITWDCATLRFYPGAFNVSPMLYEGVSTSSDWCVDSGLWLGYNDWLTSYKAKDEYYYNAGAVRCTGLIACLSGPNVGKVKLIVSNGSLTVSNFRTAMQAYLGITDGPQISGEYQAVMLDGGKSSEMVAKNVLGGTVVFPSDQTRGIPEIITLKT